MAHSLRLALICGFALVLAACGSTTTATPTSTISSVPSAVPTNANAEPVAYADLPQSKTAEGYPVLGDPDAPTTLTMYSDFL
jgi:protein-disulfide isomerase